MTDTSDDRFTCGGCGRGFSSFVIFAHHREEECTPQMCRRCRREPASQEGLCYLCHYYGH